jgi:hypothetical protein
LVLVVVEILLEVQLHFLPYLLQVVDEEDVLTQDHQDNQEVQVVEEQDQTIQVAEQVTHQH